MDDGNIIDISAIGKLIKNKREEAGMTQAKLAKAVGLSENTLCRYEKGNQIPLVTDFF